MDQWQCNIEMCIESAWINVEHIPLSRQYMECCQGAMQWLSVLQGLEMVSRQRDRKAYRQMVIMLN